MQNKPSIDQVRAAFPTIVIHDEFGEGGFKVTLDKKSDARHLDAMREGLAVFKEAAGFD